MKYPREKTKITKYKKKAWALELLKTSVLNRKNEMASTENFVLVMTTPTLVESKIEVFELSKSIFSVYITVTFFSQN